MNRLASTLIGLVLLLGSGSAASSASLQVYPGCAAPAAPGRVLHVSARAGSGSGAAQSPMSIGQALAAARPGDALQLATGEYGIISLGGTNAGFVTLTAEPGQKPVLTGLSIGGGRPAARWRVSNLIVEGIAERALGGDGWQSHPPLVAVNDSADIVLENLSVRTVSGAYGWQPEIKGQTTPQPLSSGLVSQNSTCVSIVGNIFENTWDAIKIGGDQVASRGTRLLIARNDIHDFGGDGIDHYGSHVIITQNAIVDGHGVCKNVCVHNDAIQGWTYNNRPEITNVDILISNNLVVDRARPTLDQPADNLQGITIFDGSWDGVKVLNNVVITGTWHGISLYGVQHAEVVNNSVLSPIAARSAWIQITNKKTDKTPMAYASLVRNNITSVIKDEVIGAKVDHNLITTAPNGALLHDPKGLFQRFDAKLGQYDLHLSNKSAALGAGERDGAPATDFDGRPRAGAIDAGAFAKSAP